MPRKHQVRSPESFAKDSPASKYVEARKEAEGRVTQNLKAMTWVDEDDDSGEPVQMVLESLLADARNPEFALDKVRALAADAAANATHWRPTHAEMRDYFDELNQRAGALLELCRGDSGEMWVGWVDEYWPTSGDQFCGLRADDYFAESFQRLLEQFVSATESARRDWDPAGRIIGHSKYEYSQLGYHVAWHSKVTKVFPFTLSSDPESDAVLAYRCICMLAEIPILSPKRAGAIILEASKHGDMSMTEDSPTD